MSEVVTRRIALLLEYDGTQFAGWQRQPQARTVQAALEEALAALTQAACRVVGAGRTDAGVHALGQVAHFSTASALPASRMGDALNAMLPDDIVVRAARETGPTFHARYDARLRVYGYAMLTRTRPSVLLRRYALHVRDPIDLETMRSAAGALVGEHDFAAFRVVGSQTASTVCVVREVRIDVMGDLSIVTVRANRFLRQMVRRMVGTLLQVGRGRLPPEEMTAILQSRDGSRAGPPAPAHGLYMTGVAYPAEISPWPDAERVVL